MKKAAAAVLTIMLIFSLAAYAGAEETARTQEQTQTEAATPDADWNLPETIEMPEKVTAIFEKAMDGLTGVGYEPVGYLGEEGWRVLRPLPRDCGVSGRKTVLRACLCE